MFKIRSEQIKTFQPDAENAFVERVMNYLLENNGDVFVQLPDEEKPHAVRQLDKKTLREMVKGGIAEARGFGIEWKSNLIQFVVLMFLTAPNFSEYQIAGEMLSSDKFLPDLRVDKLMKRMTDADWENVKSAYRREKWNLSLEEIK